MVWALNHDWASLAILRHPELHSTCRETSALLEQQCFSWTCSLGREFNLVVLTNGWLLDCLREGAALFFELEIANQPGKNARELYPDENAVKRIRSLWHDHSGSAHSQQWTMQNFHGLVIFAFSKGQFMWHRHKGVTTRAGHNFYWDSFFLRLGNSPVSSPRCST